MYAALPDLKVYLEMLDPATRVNFKVSDDGHYLSSSIVLGCMVRANEAGLAGLKNVVSLDAATMKPVGQRGVEGKLYLATQVDGSSNCHILSVGHDGNESFESWYNFISPVHKIVRKAIAEVQLEEEVSTRTTRDFISDGSPPWKQGRNGRARS